MNKPSVKNIKHAKGSLAKLGVALGRNLAFDCDAPRDEREISAIVADSEHWGKTLREFRKVEQPDPLLLDSLNRCAAQTGLQIMTAIAEGDWLFLSKLAGRVQHDCETKEHSQAAAILQFGHEHNCGTKESPCDAKALESWLAGKGIAYGKNYDNETPRGLRKICESIGFYLLKKPIGRPRKTRN